MLALGYCGIRWAEASAIKAGRPQVPKRRIRIVQNYTDELGSLAHGRGQSDLLFTAPEGGPLRYSNFRQRVFDPAVRKAASTA
ncbi:hypothetical protein [Streptomyces ipomoeae]|uniref:hypothetical protein n=1 Tax=Streptomyces ipomoeae TaxID=103232 RepID=UPI0011471BA7|nr:hypothetical protein [Streptomyces ipomoeae]MDX2933046.1 hypothetical protein [Streptomyces ipomoeae]TQE16554.1 hypothetical protein SipoB123_40660 [Streptomyces ipomoeae]